MNCISACTIRKRYCPSDAREDRSGNSLLLCLTAFVILVSSAMDAGAQDDSLDYDIVYAVKPDIASQTLQVTLELRQARALLRELSMQPDARISRLEAEGSLQVSASGVRWQPPSTGGTMRWQVNVDHRRNGDGYDAWLGPEWGLFRAEDIIPRAASRTIKGANSRTRFDFELPPGWSVVTQYYGRDGRFRVSNPERRFDQPTGWIVLGRIGVRRETIAGSQVAVAGPIGNSVRRMDILALLNWTLPELARLLPELPSRLTIVSAGEPMWRGGLSAPQSLFVHADRPLISENATSTLLHEVMHMALGIRAGTDVDWIVEGLAEFYSLELLQRSGTISQTRYKIATTDLKKWARTATILCQKSSTGASTALAVTVFAELDQEIRRRTDGDKSLDELVSALWGQDKPVSIAMLRNLAEELTGHKPDALHSDKLPGCRTIVASKQAT